MSSPSSSSYRSRNTPEMEVSDSETSGNENGTSLLHQALKRKRTDSETENLFKKQFFLTTHPPNHYFNTTISSIAPSNMIPTSTILKPATSLLTSALTSPKLVTRPITGQPSATMFNSRQIFHIIQAPNRKPGSPLKLSIGSPLSETHVQLCNLLSSSVNQSTVTNSSVINTHSIQTKESDNKN